MGVNVGGLARMPHMQALWSAKLHPCDKKVVFSDIRYFHYIDDTQTTRFEGETTLSDDRRGLATRRWWRPKKPWEINLRSID
jgi:hypothetical protein